MTINFYLDKYKGKCAKTDAYISLYVRHKGSLITRSIDKISSKVWNKRKQRVNKTKGLNYIQINQRLNDIENSILSIYENVYYSSLAFDFELFRNEIDNYLRPTKKVENAGIDFEQIKCQASKKNMIAFFKSKRIASVSQINRKTLLAYMSYLENKYNYKNVTLRNYQAKAKRFLTDTLNRHDLSANFEVKKYKKHTTKVYLKKSEIEKIDSLKLSDTLESYKDLLVLNSCLGLRISDLKKITRQNIANGYLTVTTKKTNATVHIPLNTLAIAKLEKLNYQIPKLYRFNKAIREICRLAEINETINVVEYYNNKKVISKCPKYELIASHTLRRSFATNAYISGLPIQYIMQITGHTTELSFKKYLCMQGIVLAAKAKEYDFFK